MSRSKEQLTALHERTFTSLAASLGAAYNFPELEKADLEFLERPIDDQEECFPMERAEMRGLHFNFNPARFGRFVEQLSSYFSDRPTSRLGLDRVGSLLFIGTALTRPIVRYELFEKYGKGNPRHIDALGNFYQNRGDINRAFEEIFDRNPAGHHALAEQIPDDTVLRINGHRVSLCYLYGGVRRQSDKEVLGQLVTDSREVLKMGIVRDRKTYQSLGREALLATGNEVGDQLMMELIPSWMYALAIPVEPDSFGHLSSKLWQDRFVIDPEPIHCESAHELANLGFAPERREAELPSAYGCGSTPPA